MRPFPNVNDGKWQVSTAGGVQPVWAHNGRELFFVNPTGEMEVVEFTATAETFQRRRITTLFRVPAGAFVRSNIGASGDYDVALDDERFLMARRVEGGVEESVILVRNFFEELKRLVPRPRWRPLCRVRAYPSCPR